MRTICTPKSTSVHSDKISSGFNFIINFTLKNLNIKSPVLLTIEIGRLKCSLDISQSNISLPYASNQFYETRTFVYLLFEYFYQVKVLNINSYTPGPHVMLFLGLGKIRIK